MRTSMGRTPSRNLTGRRLSARPVPVSLGGCRRRRLPSPAVSERALDPTQQAVLDLPVGASAAVLGAPGSGKTATAVALVADRVVRGLLEPEQVLLLAPRRTQASRLRDRLLLAVGRPVSGPLARTAASLAFDVARRSAVAEGRPVPVLLGGGEQDRLLADLLQDPRGDWPAALGPEVRGTRAFRSELRELFARATERGAGAAGPGAAGRAARPRRLARRRPVPGGVPGGAAGDRSRRLRLRRAGRAGDGGDRARLRWRGRRPAAPGGRRRPAGRGGVDRGAARRAGGPRLRDRRLRRPRPGGRHLPRGRARPARPLRGAPGAARRARAAPGHGAPAARVDPPLRRGDHPAHRRRAGRAAAAGRGGATGRSARAGDRGGGIGRASSRSGSRTCCARSTWSTTSRSPTRP